VADEEHPGPHSALDKGTLIARHQTTGEILSFIKWLEYGPGGELAPMATVEDEWPEFCGRAICRLLSCYLPGSRRPKGVGAPSEPQVLLSGRIAQPAQKGQLDPF
jgi:hypothetical protein